MNKKVYIPISFILFVIVAGFTQIKPPVKKVYAYKQTSIPGILPIHSEENNTKDKDAVKKQPGRNQHYNYWFYMEMPRTEKIIITGLWISGIRYDLKEEVINDLPVKKIIFTGVEKNDTTVMVPVTRNKIVLIYPSGEAKKTLANSKYVSNLARTNELVISYTSKGKTYYISLKTIKEIAPDVRP